MPRHILVVDDDPQILEVVSRSLDTAHYRVSTARRVSVARDALTRQKIDLVLTDARLPGESGLDLAETTRALGIATVIMSGDREWVEQRGFAHGDYLEKPFSLHRLLSVIELCIRENDKALAPTAPPSRKEAGP